MGVGVPIVRRRQCRVDMGREQPMTDEDWEFDEARRLMRKCSCKKPYNELRYEPGVTYITCVCDTKSPRSFMADWHPKQVVRHWNATGYISLQKKY